MGTANDWMWVAFLGMFWVGGMLLWVVLNLQGQLQSGTIFAWQRC